MKRTFGFPDLSHIFIKEYLSFRVGKRKPEPGIFELVLNENNLRKEETLFFDDSIQHIEGAKRIGLAALHITDGRSILDHFN